MVVPMTTAITRTSEQEARRRSTVVWVVWLAFFGLVFDGYDQERWVEFADYQNICWKELLDLWRSYNLLIARVMEQTPEDVRTAQRAGTLAVYLLEPHSDDGFARWEFLDAQLKTGELYPVHRVPRL